jgi:hypothetical protein
MNKALAVILWVMLLLLCSVSFRAQAQNSLPLGTVTLQGPLVSLLKCPQR